MRTTGSGFASRYWVPSGICPSRCSNVANERGEAAARDAIPWLQRNQAEVHNLNASEGRRWGAQQSLLSSVKSNTGTHTGLLGGILRKPQSTTVNVSTSVVVSGSQVNQTLSSLRQTIGGGGFI